MPGKYRLLLAGLAVVGAGCGAARQSALLDGDPVRGEAAISRYGCGSCHTIPGIKGAHGLVGPPLTGFGNRMYVAGILPNGPDNLTLWIRHPKQINQKTAMPELGVTDRDSADIAAYLTSLR